MKRYQDWPERLNRYLSRPHRFDWMTNNCALFAARAAEEITGEKICEPFLGPKTVRGMISKLHRITGGSVEAAAEMIAGKEYDNVRMAKRGDVATVDTPDGPALGVVVGSKVVYLNEREGLTEIPLSKCRRAWRVG